jgi:hypothetical protein
VVFATMASLVGLPSGQAEPPPADAHAAKTGAVAQPHPAQVSGKAKAGRSTVTRRKPVAPTKRRVVKTDSGAATKSPTNSTGKATTQAMDFDADQVEGQRLQPGFELIEGSPRPARHSSLVPFPPKPEDSVVRGN